VDRLPGPTRTSSGWCAAATAPGPAILALRTGAPLIPLLARRQEDGSHVVQLRPPLDWVATGDRDQGVRRITAQLTQAIERQIRAEPAQWFLDSQPVEKAETQ
jgi:KDO2-lipid IV(A) lauroyltransferase